MADDEDGEQQRSGRWWTPPAMKYPRRFVPADAAQQTVGGILLAGPFVVTEEVWHLAQNMTWVHAVGIAILVSVIGYGALYKTGKTKKARDPDKEAQLIGIPVRFISLLCVAYVSVAILVTLFTAPATFDMTWTTAVKAINIGAIFSVIGAATADSLF